MNMTKSIAKKIARGVMLGSLVLLFESSALDGFQVTEAPQRGDTLRPSGVQNTGDSANPSQAESGNMAQKEGLIEALIKEVNDLTPGGIRGDEKLKSEVDIIVRKFVDNPGSNVIEALERLRQSHPQLPPAALLLAALHYSVGNRADGQRHLEDAAISNPELPTIYNAFARLAIADGRRTDASVLLEKSRQLIDSGKFSEKETAFFDLIYRDALADLMLFRNDFGVARDLLESLVASNPEMAKNYMRLAQVSFRQQKTDECLKQLEEFRKRVPESRVPELMLATMYSQVGLDNQSQVWVEKAYNKYAQEKVVALEYVDWMVAHEKFAEASAALEKSQALLGDLPGVLMLKGKIAFAREQYSQAEQIFAKVRTAEPTNVEVSTMLAISMAELGEPEKLEKALEIAKQNVQLQPQNPVAMSVLGWVFFKQNNLQAAGECLNRAGQLGQLAPESLYYIAKFLEARGQKDQAAQFVDKALETTALFLYRQEALKLKQLLAPSETLSPPKK